MYYLIFFYLCICLVREVASLSGKTHDVCGNHVWVHVVPVILASSHVHLDYVKELRGFLFLCMHVVVFLHLCYSAF